MILSLAIIPCAYSADITRSLQDNILENTEPDNFFEIGIGVGASIGSRFRDDDGKGAGLNLYVRGSYNWNGFFVDLWGESSDPLVLGYNAYNSERWPIP